MYNILFFLIVIFSSFFLTELIRRYTLKKSFLDTPNERSSHSVATPRGGGVSIVVLFLVLISISDFLPGNISRALLGAGAFVAFIGLWDDLGHIATKWRLLSHFLAASWAVYWLGVLPEIQILGFIINADWLAISIVIFLLVWLLNLFNFMDGIDGIAASEAIFVCSAGAYFSWMIDLEYLVFISLLLAASVLGFLFLNWSPAKIFMGDVGSGFLGIALGILIYENILNNLSIWIWVILLGIFLVDSGITLLRRILNGERWYEAHCSHAYQHAARKWGHRIVTAVSIAINLCWLFPIAYIAYLYQNMALLLTFVAYLPLVILALKFNAGLSDNN